MGKGLRVGLGDVCPCYTSTCSKLPSPWRCKVLLLLPVKGGQEASGGQGERSPDVHGKIPSGKGDVGKRLELHQ